MCYNITKKQKGGGKMLYILNTMIVPVNFDDVDKVFIDLRRISLDDARKIVKELPFISAVGHDGTAKLLSEILEVDIPCERRTVYMRSGDMGLHFFLKKRLPEGVILTKDDLEDLPYWLVLSIVLQERK